MSFLLIVKRCELYGFSTIQNDNNNYYYYSAFYYILGFDLKMFQEMFHIKNKNIILIYLPGNVQSRIF